MIELIILFVCAHREGIIRKQLTASLLGPHVGRTFDPRRDAPRGGAPALHAVPGAGAVGAS